jgi:paraquat-inducible protein B
VKSILLNVSVMSNVDRDADDIRIPVIIELDEENIAQKGGKVRPDPETIAWLVSRGLRAQLSSESIVTGVLYVKLDMQPDSPIRMAEDPTVPYPEIPTLPTPLEEVQMRASQFLAQLEKTDFEGLLASLRGTLDGASRLLNSPDLETAVASLDETVHRVDALIARMDETLTSVDALAEQANAQIGSFVTDAGSTLAAAGQTLDAATSTLDEMRIFVAPDSPLVYQIRETLQDLSASARAIRRLTDDLQRNPSMLVRGKTAPEESK